MSGIIGGAGSKSGVIGKTEIDYEEGNWTPTGTGVDSSSVGTYVKIGDMVFCSGWIITDGASTQAYGGLPFTSFNAGNAAWGGNTAYQNADTTNKDSWGLLVSGNNTTFNVYRGNSGTGLGSGKQMHFHLMYRAV